jgi:hypothetical protein
MKAIVGRLRRIETRMGLVETEENRRARQQLEILQQRIARRARDEGREYEPRKSSLVIKVFACVRKKQ